ncbi:MAG: DUF4352 domain-containing protein [Clostridia bacterium]|mgnify:CR=1 FL=1|nr:DUF4352 domain-containing protein [Clostridia bacterium]
MKKIIYSIILLSCLIIPFSFLLAGCDLANNSNNSTTTYYLGETAKNSDGVEFVVLNVKDTQSIGGRTTENNYMIITIKITNKSKEAWSQNPNNCVLILNDAEYEYSSLTYLLEDGMSGFDEINPQLSRTFSIVFETPTKSTENIYKVKLSGYSLWKDDGVIITLKEKQ